MKRLILIICLFMAGCGVDNNNHGYGYDIDGITPLGIEYRGYDISEINLDNEFNYVYQCITENWRDTLNNNINGYEFYIDLSVYFVERIENSTSQGRFYNSNNLIVIVNKNSIYHNDDSIYIYRHELVHYILKELTGNSHNEHQSIFFYSCVYF